MSFVVEIRQVEGQEDLGLATYATAGSAGVDLRASEAARIEPGQRLLVPTGVQVAIPAGYEGQIRPRSGLALRVGLTVLNSPGTIDSDYRGELKVILIHHGSEAYEIARGERIAQLVFAPVVQAAWRPVAELSPADSTRGEAGFGHTGRH